MASEDNNRPAPIEDERIIRSGWLHVGNGHEIYWVDWGNRKVKDPIFYLHGGPGAGFDEGDFSKFNPVKHRVVFHDQRGSGRSTPFALKDHNTTQDLINDITKLRAELGFEKISLYGFSWGSTLALLYAISNPVVINTMLIGSIFLARKADNDFYLRGSVASHFPEVWERFVSLVPESERGNVAEYYRSQVFGEDDAAKARFAREWMIYELSTLRLDYVPADVERGLQEFAAESLTHLDAHYVLNNCFIEENFIIENAAVLKDIPMVIVQGRYDFICMPAAAYELRKVLGDKALLHFVTAGHSSGDMVQREVVRAYANILWP